MLKVVLGGTFEYVHAGHIALIREAFSLVGTEGNGNGVVHIGLTSDSMAGKKKHAVSSFDKRKNALENCIRHILDEKDLTSDNYMITALDDPFGPAVSELYDYIVVSPETRVGADKINELRKQKGLAPITIREVPFVPAEDGIPISSTRIYYGEIDRNGRIKKE